MRQALRVFLALLVPMALLAVCACHAQVVPTEQLLELLAFQCVDLVLLVFHVLLDQTQTKLFAQQDPSAWPIAAPFHVTLVFSAQQERNLFKITTPSALQVCTVLLEWLRFVALPEPSLL